MKDTTKFRKGAVADYRRNHFRLLRNAAVWRARGDNDMCAFYITQAGECRRSLAHWLEFVRNLENIDRREAA